MKLVYSTTRYVPAFDDKLQDLTRGLVDSKDYANSNNGLQRHRGKGLCYNDNGHFE